MPETKRVDSVPRATGAGSDSRRSVHPRRRIHYVRISGEPAASASRTHHGSEGRNIDTIRVDWYILLAEYTKYDESS